MPPAKTQLLKDKEKKWKTQLKTIYPYASLENVQLRSTDRTRQAQYYAALEAYSETGQKKYLTSANKLASGGRIWHNAERINSTEDAQTFLRDSEKNMPVLTRGMGETIMTANTATREEQAVKKKKKEKERDTMTEEDDRSKKVREKEKEVKEKVKATREKFTKKEEDRERKRKHDEEMDRMQREARERAEEDERERRERRERYAREDREREARKREETTMRDIGATQSRLIEDIGEDAMQDLERYDHERANEETDDEIKIIEQAIRNGNLQPAMVSHLKRHVKKLQERKNIAHHHRHHGFERAESEMRRIREEDAFRARTNEDAAQHLRGFVPTRGHREAEHTARAVHATDNPRLNIQPLNEVGGANAPVATLQENDAYVMARDGTVPMNSIFLDDRVDPVAPPHTRNMQEQAQANANFEARHDTQTQHEISQINEEQQLESVALMGETNADAGVITGVFNPSNIPSGREGQEAGQALVDVSRAEVAPQLISPDEHRDEPAPPRAASDGLGGGGRGAERLRERVMGGGVPPVPAAAPPAAPIPSTQGADVGDRYEYDIGYFDQAQAQGGGVGLPTQDAIMKQLDVGSSKTHKEAEKMHRQRATTAKLKEEIACLFKVYEPLISDLRTEREHREKDRVLKSDSHELVARYHEHLTQIVRGYMQGSELKVGVIISADSIGMIGRGVQGQTTNVPAVPVGAGGASAPQMTGTAPQYRLTKSGQDKFVHTSASHQEVMRGGRRTFDIIESRKPQAHPELHPQPGRIPKFVTRARNPYPSIAIARNPAAGMALRIPGRKANHFDEF